MINRRGFLSVLAAPAIIRPGLLMPIFVAPQQFLPCDGRAVSRSRYRELFSYIGTLYGGGDGVFNLPDHRRVLAAQGNGVVAFISTSFVRTPHRDFGGIATGAILLTDGSEP